LNRGKSASRKKIISRSPRKRFFLCQFLLSAKIPKGVHRIIPHADESSHDNPGEEIGNSKTFDQRAHGKYDHDNACERDSDETNITAHIIAGTSAESVIPARDIIDADGNAESESRRDKIIDPEKLREHP